METSRKRTIAISLFVLLLVVLAWVIVSATIQEGDVASFIDRYKSYGPLIAIPVIIVEVVIAPIPGTIVPIVLGSLYGSGLAALYAWIGNVIGSSIAFWLARRFGRRVISWVFPTSNLQAFDAFFTNHPAFLWIVYAFPVFPVDIISFSVGLSKKSFKSFFRLIAVAFIPHLLALTLLGDQLASWGASQRTLAISVGIAVLAIVFFIERGFTRRIQRSYG